MNKNSCYTYFVIEGIFNPDDITKILNLMPYKIVRIGDVMKNNKISKVAKWYFNKNNDCGNTVKFDVKAEKPLEPHEILIRVHNDLK